MIVVLFCKSLTFWLKGLAFGLQPNRLCISRKGSTQEGMRLKCEEFSNIMYVRVTLSRTPFSISLEAGFPFMLLFRKEIHRQIDEYIEFRTRKFNTSTVQERQTLLLFTKFAKIQNVHEITAQQVEDFKSLVFSTRTQFFSEQAHKTLRCFLRFHQRYIELFKRCDTLGKMKKTRTRPGPLPDIEKDKEIVFLKDIKEMSFRQIEKKTGINLKNVYLRYKRGVGQLY